MALEENVATLEGIDETYHDLYVENAEGTFDINITGLKTALNKERTTRKKLEKKINTNLPAPDDSELQTQLTDAKSTIRNMKVGGRVKSVALASGVDPEYIDDVMNLTKGNFALSDDGNVVVIDADGDPTGQTVDKYFKVDYKKSKPRFYNGSNKSGGGSQGSLNSADPLSYNGQLKKAIDKKDTLSIITLKNKLK